MRRFLPIVAFIPLLFLYFQLKDEWKQYDHLHKSPMDAGSDDLERAIEDLNVEIQEHRISAWYAKLVLENNHHQIEEGVLETDLFEFHTRWEFKKRNVLLRLTQRLDLDEEEKQNLHSFTTTLKSAWSGATTPESPWSRGIRLIEKGDIQAGRNAIESLSQFVIQEALNSKKLNPDWIKIMQGRNQTQAMQKAYQSLLGSGKEITGRTVTGKVFSFQAVANFNDDETVSASLFVNGR